MVTMADLANQPGPLSPGLKPAPTVGTLGADPRLSPFPTLMSGNRTLIGVPP